MTPTATPEQAKTGVYGWTASKSASPSPLKLGPKPSSLRAMSEIFTLIIVIGASGLAVALLVALNAFMGGWTRARLGDVAVAGERIAVDVLDFRPSPLATLDVERTAALVFEQGGDRLGLAVCRGDKITVRALRAAELISAEAIGSELNLRLDDYTLPKVSLRLGDPAQAQRWAEDLTAFNGQTNSKTLHAEST